MPDGEDWLYRPVSEGLCKYESLIDGTLGIEDVAIMNDIIAVREENRFRYQDWIERNK